jgi:outer membrane immunogenic protein
MRRSPIISVVSAGLFVGLSAAAFAADLPAKSPPYVAPAPVPWTWTGIYGGFNLDYGFADPGITETFTGPGISFSTNQSARMNGWGGGGQAGYNWQYGNWVTGIESDYEYMSQKKNDGFICPTGFCAAAGAGPLTGTYTEKLEWYGTTRLRLGWAIQPKTLIYVSGGLAYGEFLLDGGRLINAVSASPFTRYSVETGYAVGGGIEQDLLDRWTWKLEYLLVDLKMPTNSFATSIGPAPGDVFTVSGSRFEDSIVRAALDYHFK